MARMLDRLISERWQECETFPKRMLPGDGSLLENIRRELPESVCVIGDEVGELVQGQVERQWDLTEDIPNAAPPFPNLWVEYRKSERALPVGGGDLPLRGGTLMLSYDPASVAQLPSGVLTRMLEKLGEVKWVVQAFPFYEYRSGVYGPLCALTYGVCEDGKIEQPPWIGAYGERTEYNGVQIENVLQAQLLIPLMTVSFMHCKNVARVENAPSEKLSKAHQRRHGKPLVRYYTLQLHPMREALRGEGQSESVGIQRALHLVRGHFRTYREEKPLFGKYHGTFWVPLHASGSVREGVVVKDYEVKGVS